MLVIKMDTRNNFSNTVYRFAEFGEQKALLSASSPDEFLNNSSPPIRKVMPQTSIFMVKEKLKRPEHRKPRVSLENEIELINFSHTEKIIATKALRVLISDIVSTYPQCKFRKDLYDSNSEVYKYCFTESLKKLRSINDLKSEPNILILSRRHKIHKSELNLKPSPQKSPHKIQSYQMINFNSSITKCLTDRRFEAKHSESENPKKRILKILKSTRQKLLEKRFIMPTVFAKSQISKEYPGKKLLVSQSSMKSDSKRLKSFQKIPADPLIIPSKLFNQLISSQPRTSSQKQGKTNGFLL